MKRVKEERSFVRWTGNRCCQYQVWAVDPHRPRHDSKCHRNNNPRTDGERRYLIEHNIIRSRFVTSLGKIGNAKEAREAVSKLINMRVSPISNALDYEAFLTEFNGDLESDPLRDLLLFPRDDIQLVKPCQEELDAVEKVSSYFASSSGWQLTRDSLQFFTLPCSLIKFNYERFFGDCEK